ncbi:MAG TPA: 2-oxoacid:acceptor oxidoreductase subunit alpha, partial [Trueperaceae bacterium]|nr:2-oxoacid:acceptor oxidoreductase subunit alpha [Trueperaceae bacterium]
KMPPKQKSYVANMVYVGALAWLIDIPLANLEEALSVQFGGRQKLVDINMPLIKQSYDWAKENLPKQNRFKVEKMNKTDGLIMMTGNEAAALGAIYGGVSFVSWYPITPSTGIVDNLLKYLPKLRKDKDGNPSYAVVQAEDELAAAGMIIGAGWAGARSMTATSGPGISLMAEFTGLAYVAEIPTVIWDVQRVGPSTGLPTRTAQCDVAFVYTLGHGDTNNPVLLPSSIEEAFEFGYKALDLADQLQSPVFVLSDLDLGMNNWMGHPFEYPKEDIKRGKVLDAQELTEVENYGRYKDIDGDGIPYRTIPGNSNPKSAWFARGVGHDEYAVYSEDPEVFAATMARKARKFNTARSLLPEAEVKLNKKAELGIIAYGTTRYAIEEAIDLLKAQGLELSFLRLKALPVDKKLVRDFIESHKNNYVIELNRDGQVFRILQNEFPDLTSKLASIAHIDGMPLMATWVKEQILEDQA